MVIVLWPRIVCETKIQFVVVEYHCAIRFPLSPLGALSVAGVADTVAQVREGNAPKREEAESLSPQYVVYTHFLVNI